jgi:hypothetical protein
MLIILMKVNIFTQEACYLLTLNLFGGMVKMYRLAFSVYFQ